MLTLAFLWTWTKTTVVALLAVVIERATLTSMWAFVPVATITVLIYVVISVGLFREWRSQATGHHHQITSIRRERV
ncbi:hypothetical protein DI005_16185 [Prauserella sp. PE36]|uniref:Uncharacterized protein n=1 Tax=Prauserella endophytica TaxID=1592324 RepID=A0ABY2RST1_9PSEU|nr:MULTISPECIES: hypothetical protein [Prauserella]RBM19230.1 hypothetical protein DI005_16185 [Prauserella sp. PE36]TKG57846.1 hypothetical protein FCN18_38655 [Prauserella endophytica]